MSAADALLARVQAFGAPFGLERSVKLVDGALLRDRCLMSLHVGALGRDPLAALVAAMDPPAPLRAGLAEALPGADVVHFGHEADAGFVLRKLYLEYAARARAGMARGEPALAHVAFKWRTDTGAAAMTRYVWRPCGSMAQARARIAERVPGPRARAAALRLLDRAEGRGDVDMLDVEEPGLARLSLDINVYDCDLTVGDAADIIDEASAAFGVAAAHIAEVFTPVRSKALGHLAAGLDRTGREFLTFYFGVEAREP